MNSIYYKMSNAYPNYSKQQSSKGNCNDQGYLGKKRQEPENTSSRECKKRPEYDEKYCKYEKYGDKYSGYDKYENSHFSQYSSNKGNHRNSSKYRSRDNYDSGNPCYIPKYHQNMRGKSPLKESYKKYGDQTYKKSYSRFNDDEGVRNLSAQCEILSPLQSKVSEVNSLIPPNSAKNFNLVQGINNFVSNIVSSQFQAKPGTFQNIFQNQPNINIKINLTSTPSQLALCAQTKPGIQEHFRHAVIPGDVQHDMNSKAIATVSSASLPLMQNTWNISNKSEDRKLASSSLTVTAPKSDIYINEKKEITGEQPTYYNPFEFDPLPVRAFLEEIKNENEKKSGNIVQETVKLGKNALLAFLYEKNLENKKIIQKLSSNISVDDIIKERETFSSVFQPCEDTEMKVDTDTDNEISKKDKIMIKQSESSHYLIFDEKFKLPQEKLTNDQISKKVRNEIGYIKKKSEKEMTERKIFKDKVYRLENRIKLLTVKGDEIQSKLDEIFSEY